MGAEPIDQRAVVVVPEHLRHWHLGLTALGQPRGKGVSLFAAVQPERDMDVFPWTRVKPVSAVAFVPIRMWPPVIGNATLTTICFCASLIDG